MEGEEERMSADYEAMYRAERTLREKTERELGKANDTLKVLAEGYNNYKSENERLRAELDALRKHVAVLESSCGARDPHSPRRCDRPKGHDGDHDQRDFPVGEMEPNRKWTPLPVPDIHVAVSPEAVDEVILEHEPVSERARLIYIGAVSLACHDPTAEDNAVPAIVSEDVADPTRDILARNYATASGRVLRAAEAEALRNAPGGDK